MPILLPADAVPAAALHAAFVRAFSDYVTGPVVLPVDAWPGFLARQAVDLSLSRVRVAEAGEGEDGDHADRIDAFAFVAPRARRRWRLATMGAVPEARGQGGAPALLDDLVVRARQAGVTTLELEVFARNERARRLYEGRGFVKCAELHGWEGRPVPPTGRDRQGAVDAAMHEVPLEAAFAWLDDAAARVDDLPLQVLPPVLRALPGPLVAWRLGGAQAVVSPPGVAGAPVLVASFVDLDGRTRADAGAADADRLVAALAARYPGRDVRLPAFHRPDMGPSAFDRAGVPRQPLHQWLMRRDEPSAGSPGPA